MIQLGELDVLYLPNVSTSVMHFVSSCRSMSLGTVSGLLSMWPLYFLWKRRQSSKIKKMQQGQKKPVYAVTDFQSNSFFSFEIITILIIKKKKNNLSIVQTSLFRLLSHFVFYTINYVKQLYFMASIFYHFVC